MNNLEIIKNAEGVFKEIRGQLCIEIVRCYEFNQKKQWCNTSNENIARLFNIFDFSKIRFYTYYSNWFSRNVVAYTYGKGDITFNERVINANKSISIEKAISSAVGTIAHECTHIIDAYDSESFFNHGSNSWTQEKYDFSAPYLIGRIAQKLAEQYLKKEKLL